MNERDGRVSASATTYTDAAGRFRAGLYRPGFSALFAVVGLPFGPTGQIHPHEAEPGWQIQCDAADDGPRVSKQGRALGSPRPPQ